MCGDSTRQKELYNCFTKWIRWNLWSDAPVAQTVTRLPAMQETWVRFLDRIPWRRKWQSTPALLPGKSHGQRSLVGYSPWGHKESDKTEQRYFHFTKWIRWSLFTWFASVLPLLAFQQLNVIGSQNKFLFCWISFYGISRIMEDFQCVEKWL